MKALFICSHLTKLSPVLLALSVTLSVHGLDFPFFEAIATNLSRCSYLVSIPPLGKALIAVGFKMLFVAGGKGVGISPVSKKPYHLETCGVNIFMWGEKRGLA